MRLLNIEPKDRIILPLDVSDVRSAIVLAEKLKDHVGVFKIGLEFIYSTIGFMMTNPNGAAAYFSEVNRLFEMIGPKKIFLDVKLDDIPNTVGGASRAIAAMKPLFFNVHASAGLEAIKAAVANKGQSKVLGVTVLTSIMPDECQSIFGDQPESKVIQFVKMLSEAKADGVICSPKEIKTIRAWDNLHSLMIVTPGVRPVWAAVNDQKRIMTPGEAILAGADALVIGRPITDAPNQVDAAKRIAEEIGDALPNEKAMSKVK